MISNMLISIYVRRDCHENGMTLEQYAEAVVAGTQPILDHDEFAYQFGSIKDEIDLVVEWATRNQLTIFEAKQDIATVKVYGTPEQFSKLFSVKLKEENNYGTTYITYDGKITIPNEINDVVDQILGLNNSPIFKNYISTSHNINANDEPKDISEPYSYPTKSAIRPNQVSIAYNMPTGSASGASIGIIALTYSSYVSGWNQTDVDNSFNRIGITPPIVQEVLVDGATRSLTSDSETLLDIYCAGGAAGTGSNVTVYMAPNSVQGFLDGILACAADTVNNPSVLSISWGTSYERVNDEYGPGFLACVAKGITVFVASGDRAANNLTPGYPASNPYVVAAGGTSLYMLTGYAYDRESVWNEPTNTASYPYGQGSGGGISNIFSVPSWQTGLRATQYSYSAGTGTTSVISGRGYPDFSAPGDPNTGYLFYLNGSLYGASAGTSAAAPVLAGFFAKLNVLLGQRVGYVNPKLYANPQVFTPITDGNNAAQQTGYLATASWNPAIGFGSPNFSAVYELYKKTLNYYTYPKNNFGTRNNTVTYPRRTNIINR
jgi:kumamolisin